MTDYLDPEAPSPDPHAEDDRPRWTPVYMGEAWADRCKNCGSVKGTHHPEKGLRLLCAESFLRLMDGNR